MIYDAIRVILGLLFGLFVPGFLIVLIFFDEMKILERFAFSVGFSIIFDVMISVYFGYDQAQALRTGGLTFSNILLAEAILIPILVAALLIKIFVFKKQVFLIKKK
jgi:uncharacterized membrane protein